MKRFENIWLSTENHLINQNEIRRESKILRNVLDPNVPEKFYDFPRVQVGNNVFPVIFQNIGRLILSDSTIQFFVSDNWDSNKYAGINKGENLFISYSQIENVELFCLRLAILPYFDNYWIKILYSENGLTKDILLSHSGKGLVMRKIKRENQDLLNQIKEIVK
jgi:hypothetical protein